MQITMEVRIVVVLLLVYIQLGACGLLSEELGPKICGDTIVEKYKELCVYKRSLGTVKRQARIGKGNEIECVIVECRITHNPQRAQTPKPPIYFQVRML